MSNDSKTSAPLSKSLAIPTVQIKNDRFIVTEWRFAPGAETGWHRHAYDYIVVPQTTGQLRIELADNSKVMSDLFTGQSYNRLAGVEHNVINANDYEFVFVEIELK
jgi:quercetin dioxygenase-like cupin family protein